VSKGLIDSPTFRQRTMPIAGITDHDPRVAATSSSSFVDHVG